MDTIEIINRHLAGVALERKRRSRDDKPGPPPFVTISRESGAGGHALAEALLEAFENRSGDSLFEGWRIFDRELCELVANDPKLTVGLRSLLDESSLNAVEDLVSVMLGKSPQRDIQRKIAETIRELAVVGKAIIIGRGGECVTRDLPSGFHLRLVAPFPLRVERESRERSEEVGNVEKWVREQDRNRASLIERVYGHKIDSPLLYDAIWNTERVALENVVQSVVHWVEQHRSG